MDVARRLERPVRLTTGLILFAFATSHLINHAFGIRSLDAMQAASAVLLAPWQTSAGLIVLYTAFLCMGFLGSTRFTADGICVCPQMKRGSWLSA